MDRIPEEVIEAYERSDSYKKLEKLRDAEREVLKGYYNKYRFKEQYLKAETEKMLDHERYAKGGLALHRGILCPGNMAALTIGNITRGKFIKNKKNADFVYGYDKDDTLILCEMTGSDNITQTEYIFWENDTTQIGVRYESLLGIAEISEAKYSEQGKILSYFHWASDSSIVIEKYLYKENKVYVEFLDAFGDEYISGEHIVLYTEESGLVTKYTSCTDMRQDEVYEYIPKYKLIL